MTIWPNPVIGSDELAGDGLATGNGGIDLEKLHGDYLHRLASDGR